MSKVCKACSTENRDEAAFCRSCGAPLKKNRDNLRKSPKQKEQEAKIKAFWMKVFIAAVVVSLVMYFIMTKRSFMAAVEAYDGTMKKYEETDDKVFGTIKKSGFNFEALSWNMTEDQIKQIYPYAAESNDPDFLSSLSVAQNDLKVFIPHAKFMSLGLANSKLYAVKFEFGAMEEAPRQQLKVPDKDEIIYGRFRGMYRKFKELYGPPVFEKFEVKDMELLKLIKTVKKGKLKNKQPSNIYVTWTVGKTKVELVLFGANNELHLTVRFLYLPVWELVGK